MNIKRAYCGLLDDFAARNKDPLAIGTLAELNNHLISSVIVGDPLLINDGYLVMNPRDPRGDREPEEESVPGAGPKRIHQVVTRNGGDLPGLAQLMADQNIESARKLMERPDLRTRIRARAREVVDIAQRPAIGLGQTVAGPPHGCWSSASSVAASSTT